MTASAPVPLPEVGALLHDDPGWRYPSGCGSGSGVCRLRVWTSADCGLVAVVSELAENPGASVTNSAEHIIPALSRAWPGPMVVIEHYPAREYASPRWLRQPRLDRVYLAGRTPQWQPLWPVHPGCESYDAHWAWALVYAEQITGQPPEDDWPHD